MASNCARNIVNRSISSAKTLLCRAQSSHSVASGRSNFTGLAPTNLPLSLRRRLFFSARLPVEVGCAESLMPLHSATASALLKSMLSSKVGRWGFLSEGMTKCFLQFPSVLALVWVSSFIYSDFHIYYNIILLFRIDIFILK
ncbi:UNVERIFIED_CONTAM: protein NUCLEAR FUSION defective, chloroplastic/mitochondrial [Sesamum latifolium]|uniref:Protein NUCLEAR FUSION defective, chloroplastic/mitochondrial n=1 Tax=Sesamum latifolium TaxID=2727402 RepID=A0AAW2Y7C7_9LAMI